MSKASRIISEEAREDSTNSIITGLVGACIAGPAGLIAAAWPTTHEHTLIDDDGNRHVGRGHSADEARVDAFRNMPK